MKARLVAQGFGLSAILAAPALAQADHPRSAEIDNEGRTVTVLSPLRVDARPVAKDYVTPLSFNATDFQAIAAADRVQILDFPLDRFTTVDLELTTFEVFSPTAVRVAASPEGDRQMTGEGVTLLRGNVVGMPDSWVYLAVSPNMNNGIIDLGGTSYVVSNGFHNTNQGAHIYNMSDMPEGEIDWVEWACTVIDPGTDGGQIELGDGMEPQPCRLAKVAIETDNEFADKFGTDPMVAADLAEAYIETLVGGVREIYIREFNMDFEIVYTRVYAGGANANPDNWNGASTYDQLIEVQDLWTSAAAPAVDGGVWNSVHMLSGRPLGGGIAYLRAICNEDIAMAVSANLSGVFPTPLVDNDPQNWDLIVTAHEWGHNFGAPHTHGLIPFHDACGFGDCSLAETGTIMSYCHLCPGGLENIALTFAPRILTEGIIPYVTLSMPCDLVDTTGTACIDTTGCLGDLNGDGMVTGLDFNPWILAYQNNDPAADINRSGTVEPTDFNAWLAAYNHYRLTGECLR